MLMGPEGGGNMPVSNIRHKCNVGELLMWICDVQIFVGGLDPSVTDEDLKAVFGQFGELVYVKIPVGKGCGFVQFTHR
jgi:hypothetical protein